MFYLKLCFSSKFFEQRIEGLPLEVTKIFNSFIRALFKPFSVLSKILKNTKFTFTSMVMSFFSTIIIAAILIPTVIFCMIVFRVLSFYDILNTIESIKELFEIKLLFKVLIFIVTLLACMYGTIWYFMSKAKNYKPGRSHYTLSLLQGILTLIGVLPFIGYYIYSQSNS